MVGREGPASLLPVRLHNICKDIRLIRAKYEEVWRWDTLTT